MYQQPLQKDNKYDLNYLLAHCTHSHSSKFLPCTKLIALYKPRTEDEFYNHTLEHAELTKNTKEETKTVWQCAEHAYSEQAKYGCNYSFDELYEFLYDLLITKSMLGAIMENKAVNEIAALYPTLKIEKTDSITDEKYSVDILVRDKNEAVVFGIQVKPRSYAAYADVETKKSNLRRNKDFMNDFNLYDEVYYLYYNKEQKEFVKFDRLRNELRHHVN